MNNVIEFNHLAFNQIARPDEWRRKTMRDALISIIEAPDLARARELAAAAIAEICDEVPT